MSRRSKDTEDPTAMDEDQKDEQEDNMDEGSNDQEDEESEESEGEEPQVEYMVPKRERSRRANAGNKMAALLESAIHDDDFYSSAYGGFKEDDQDTAYVSPGHSDSDADEVDSDFDQPEVEDEPASDQEDPDKPRRSKRKGTYKEPSRGSLIEKNRKWVVARMGGAVVAPNACDPKTQAERLKEAEKTEKENTESLKKYEEFELERKKRREKQVDRRVPPPFIKERSSINGDLIVVPDVKRFHSVHKPSAFVCAVTGRKAKYRDPLTGLPYSSQFAFKVIRDKYTKYLKTKKGNPEVDAYLAQFY